MAVRISSVALLIALALTGTAAADTPDEANGRYTMSPVDGGFLRLDKQTGAVAMCARSGGDWACKPVEDRTGDSALERAVETRRREQGSQGARQGARGEPRERQAAAERGSACRGPPGGKVQLPTEEEVDQALDYLEHVYKKVRDRIKELDKPLPPAGDGNPKPDKNSL